MSLCPSAAPQAARSPPGSLSHPSLPRPAPQIQQEKKYGKACAVELGAIDYVQLAEVGLGSAGGPRARAPAALTPALRPRRGRAPLAAPHSQHPRRLP
jgi:hypothetical protein